MPILTQAPDPNPKKPRLKPPPGACDAHIHLFGPAAMFVFFGIQLGGVLQRIRLNAYQKSFAPASDFVRKNASGDQMIMGSAELGFGLGNFDHLIDDSRLGFYSGKKPDFIVLEEVYLTEIDSYKDRHPDIYQFIKSRLSNEYQKVYDQENYEIYSRRR